MHFIAFLDVPSDQSMNESGELGSLSCNEHIETFSENQLTIGLFELRLN